MTYTSAAAAKAEAETYFDYYYPLADLSDSKGHNDEMDAFRHAYVSAVIAYERGDDVAAALGWAHEMADEVVHFQPANEYDMDSFNNEQGRLAADDIAPETVNYKALIASAIADKLDNGDLIVLNTHFSDSSADHFTSVLEATYKAAADEARELLDEVKADWAYHDSAFPVPANDPPVLPDICSTAQADYGTAEHQSSPLVIDLSSGHSGIELTTFDAEATTTFFDLRGTGFAVQTAWVDGDTGLLARDVNENGKIDDAGELFGSPTVDGFAKLALLDSNHDLRIDNTDAAWDSLVVWTDDNHDAVTQDGELHSLGDLNIESIDLAGVAASTSTIDGNPISHVSTVAFTGGDTADIADAWFVHNATNSYYNGDYTLDTDTLFLPDLRGYGTIADLTVAMSQDGDLKDMVSDLADGFGSSGFALYDSLDSDFADILYKWAGVDGVDPGSRGGEVDARTVAFIEKVMDDNYHNGNSTDPVGVSGTIFDDIWSKAFHSFEGQFLLQAGGSDLFDSPVTYNPWTGTASGYTSLSETAVAGLETAAPGDPGENVAYWTMIGHFIDAVAGVDNLSGTEQGWLDATIYDTNVNLSWNDIVHIVGGVVATNTINGTGGNDTITGTDAADTITGSGGNDVIHGGSSNDAITTSSGTDTIYGDSGSDVVWAGDGNDTIYGGNGHDQLHGEAGNDILDGGTGGNFLYGSYGDDIYVHDAAAQDYIDDGYTGGTDQINLSAGIVLADLSFARVVSSGDGSVYDDLLITIDGGGTIEINRQLDTGSSNYHIETILFSDTSTLDLSTIGDPQDVYLANGGASFGSATSSDLIIHGGTGADTIDMHSNSGNNIIDGGAGNDALTGGSGDDTFIASPGFDHITETGGTDTIVIPEAYSPADVVLYHDLGSLYDLRIDIQGLGEIGLDAQFYGSGTDVEYLHFLSNDSTVTLGDIPILTVGGSGDDYVQQPYSANNSGHYILDGAGGDDSLHGGSGDTTYIFSPGHDVIYENGGEDTILIREIYAPEDISLVRTNGGSYGDLLLTDSDGNTLTVNSHFSSGYGIEHIVFSDSTTWDLSSIEVETHGTSGADTLYGGNYGGDASSNDTIYGYGGADSINGGAGDDVLYGGDGNDTLDGADHDILYGDAGADTFTNSGSTGSVVTMHGGGDNDTMDGGYTSDTIMWGDAGNDTLTNSYYGTVTMHGGAGEDTLVGSLYAPDIFVFEGATAFDAIDQIQHFGTAQNDVIDIADVIEGYNPLTQAITDWVQIATSGSDSTLSVDIDGAGTSHTWAQIATIIGVTGLTDEAALVTNGNLVVS